MDLRPSIYPIGVVGVKWGELKYERLKSLIGEVRASNPDSFVNSALYYLLTGRKGAWLHEGFSSCVVTCLHPHVENRLLVFPEIGEESDYRLTALTLNKIDPPANGVQLARYSANDLKRLKQRLAQLDQTTVKDIAVAEESIMDWRYPVRILETKRVATMGGAEFAKIRNKVRKAAGIITVTPLHSGDGLRMMRTSLQSWEENMILKRKSAEDMSALYHELFKIVRAHPDSIDGLFFQQGRRPVGFTTWDTPRSETVNLFANLGDISVAGLSDFQMVTSCSYLQRRGISYVNVGGSELEGLDAFKAKYHPVKTIHVLTAQVSYRVASAENIGFIRSSRPFLGERERIQ